MSRLVKISKYLSKYLRHSPHEIGLTLAPGGWVGIEDLLTTCAKHGFPITRSELDLVVSTDDKQRYSFDVDRVRIRANQGHSTDVDLQLRKETPPAVLFHGTCTRFLDTILSEGLRKMKRHHVHLSIDAETATKVGRRHGNPVVLEVDAAGMVDAGYEFFVSENGVWLTDAVPPKFLKVI